MRHQESLSVFFLSAFAMVPAYGHHSAAASFDVNETIEVEGYVDEFIFKNPHVSVMLTVTHDNGVEEQWMATAPSTAAMRRWGWTADTLEEGQYVRIVGHPRRDAGPMVLLERKSFSEGSEAVAEIDPVDGSVIRNLASASQIEIGTAETLSLTLDDGRPNLTGTWLGAGPGSVNRTPAPFNEAGRAQQATFDSASDPAFTECEAPGLVRTVMTIHSAEIEQFDDRVVIAFEGGGDGRVIYLDGRKPMSDEHTRLGQAVARYEDDTLVIETTQLASRLSTINGHLLSDQTRTVETYRRADDPVLGPRLEMNITVTDPVYLDGPWEMSWQKPYAAGEYEFTGVDCRVPLQASSG